MWPALILIVLSLGTAVVYGRSRWQSRTQSLFTALQNARLPLPAAVWTQPPEPVRRYLRAVLPAHQARIETAYLTHSGAFELGGRWRPFQSRQLVAAHRPGFVWDARVSFAPLVDAWVHDAYLAGAGLLHAEILALYPVADLSHTPELAQGELHRFLAESVWYPTLLAPGGDVTWEEVDNYTAVATLLDGNVQASLRFHFNEAGLVTSVDTPARFRLVDGVAVPTPWECRLWNYQRFSDILVPTEGEVSWLLPAGPLPYWRGRLTSIHFDLERKSS